MAPRHFQGYKRAAPSEAEGAASSAKERRALLFEVTTFALGGAGASLRHQRRVVSYATLMGFCFLVPWE